MKKYYIIDTIFRESKEVSRSGAVLPPAPDHRRPDGRQAAGAGRRRGARRSSARRPGIELGAG